MADANSTPKIARYKPYYTELEPERTYLWCSCGRGNAQPFCDGSHKGTYFKPVRYKPENKGEEVLFCGCKHTKTPPFCDGSHNDLLEDYPSDDPNSEENRAVPNVRLSSNPRASLNGGCYVFSPDRAVLEEKGNLKYCSVIGPEFGAIYQSQFYFQANEGHSPLISFGDRDVVLFISEGEAEVTISGHSFIGQLHSGIYIKGNEVFSINNSSGGTVKFLASACPRADKPEWPEEMLDNFDTSQVERVVPLDPSQRQGMANRYFQMLVDKSVGSLVVTQFIGHIPLSKAEPHRHLYEEALIILTGKGCMWTENLKTPVTAGDVIFLPRKQIHSLEATNEDGMLVVGTIYPGDNPSINY